MSTNKTIEVLQNSVISFFKNKALATTAMVILGAIIAITLLQLLDQASSRDAGKQMASIKDTVYVKLVDSLSSTPIASQQESSTSVETDISSNNKSNANSSFADTMTRKNFTSSKAKPIDKFDATELEALNKAEIPVWKWLVIPSLLLIIGTNIFLSYKKLPPPNYKLNIDKDPEELTRLFERHAMDIEELGNPRKIKRFSNKVRFQYHYLKNQKLIKDDNALDKILLILLYIEKNLQKMNLDTLSENDKKNPLEWFKKLLSSEAPGFIDNNLAKHLLQLNKNVIA